MSCLWNPEVPGPGFPAKQCLESGVPKNRVRGAAPSRSGPREADSLQPPKAFPAQSPRAFIDPLSCDPSAQGLILRPLKRNKAVAEAPLEVLKLRKSPFPIFLAIQSLDAGALSLHRLSEPFNNSANVPVPSHRP